MSDRCHPHGARACRRCETGEHLDAATARGASEFKRANDNAKKLIAESVSVLLTAAKHDAWNEAVESAFLCENHPAYAVHIEHAANPYRPEEGNDRG